MFGGTRGRRTCRALVLTAAMATVLPLLPGTEKKGDFKVISSGARDAHFRTLAKKIKDAGIASHVIIRLGWEANGGNQAVLSRFPPPVNGVMEPGDLMVWSAYTIHGSRPNRSARPRRVYINGFARAADCDHGVWAARDGRAVPLRFGPETRWDAVEER